MRRDDIYHTACLHLYHSYFTAHFTWEETKLVLLKNDLSTLATKYEAWQ